jgi:hypothetical protein
MNEPRKSDSPTVPVKFPNNTGQPVAEGMEGRGLGQPAVTPNYILRPVDP